MPQYVISAWKADNEPVDDQNNYILIEGRQEGVVSWVLTKFGIAHRMRLAISGERIDFSSMSLAKELRRSIPLENVCSVDYGYLRPFWTAVGLTVFLMGVCALIGARFAGGVGLGIGGTAGVVLGIILYLLSRRLYLRFTEMSGQASRIDFKGSLIEGITVNQEAAHYVAVLTQALVDARVTARAVVNPPNN